MNLLAIEARWLSGSLPADDPRPVIRALCFELIAARRAGPLGIVGQLDYGEYMQWATRHRRWPMAGPTCFEGLRAHVLDLASVADVMRYASPR